MNTTLKKQLITIDSLHISTNIDESILTAIQKTIQTKRIQTIYTINSKVSIEISNNFNDLNYKYCDNILINNQIVAKLLHSNKNNTTNKKVLIKLLNPFFYSNEWYSNYLTIKESLKLYDFKPSYIEIANDIIYKKNNKNILQTLDYIHNTNNVKTKLKTSLRGYKPSYLDNEIVSLFIGTKKSNVGISIYNKSKELTSSNEKDYIRLYHFNNGLIGSIERIEIIFRNKNAYYFDIEKLRCKHYLNEVFIKETAKRFRLIKEQKRNNKITYIDVTPFNTSINNIDKSKYTYEPFRATKHKTNGITLRGVKQTLKTLYLLNIESKEAIYNEPINTIIKDHKLSNYYKLNKKKWNKINNNYDY